MKVLVSNIGSTSFKFRLFDMGTVEREIAVGGADRIGGKGGVLKLRICAGAASACDGGVRALCAAARTGASGEDVAAIDKRKGRCLPHWEQSGATYAVTFRLADSVPDKVVEGWRFARQDIIDRAARQNRDLSYDERVELNELFSARIESYLDAGHGDCLLKDPRAAECVQNALRHFDGDRYDLLAWSVMPNHVHAVFRPLGGHSLDRILHSWKSFTAKELNRLFGRTGCFWMDEYYDHLIRDQRDLIHQVNYAVNNPVKAGLKDWPWSGLKRLTCVEGVPPSCVAGILPACVEGVPPSCVAGILPACVEGVPPSCVAGILPACVEGIPPSCVAGILPACVEGILPACVEGILPACVEGVPPSSSPSLAVSSSSSSSQQKQKQQQQDRGRDARDTRGQDALDTTRRGRDALDTRGQDALDTTRRGRDARDTRGQDALDTRVTKDFADHGQAIGFVLEQLIAGGALASPKDLDAVAFKAVMAGDVEAVCRIDEKFLQRMEYFVPIAPAHNPPYIAAMRMFQQVLGDTPLVAAMETGFHRTVPDRRRLYAVPLAWAQDYGVKRYGFHGASHRYIATRTSELMGGMATSFVAMRTPDMAANNAAMPPFRLISCHLGGSSSLCAVRDGRSVAVSMGLSPQSGLPQSNRAGEFDPFAFSLLARQAGMDAAAVLEALGSRSGLAALSGTSGDIRDILAAIAAGSQRAKLALDLFVTAVRDYIGAYLVELGGADAIVFTGGIGQHNPQVREAICAGMEFAGIKLDQAKNAAAAGNAETRVEQDGAATAIWIMPTNEELIVARQTVELLKRH